MAHLELLRLVGVLEASVTAELDCFSTRRSDVAVERRGRILLFTGHRVDDADRVAKGKPPRFPRTAEAEEAARRAIEARIRRALSAREGAALGLAGGASGGDILFHEACAQHGIPTWLYLALPPDRYKNASVRGAGDGWLDRFDRLQAKYRLLPELRAEEVGEAEELPRELQALPDHDIWQRSNLAMLHDALAFGPDRVTLVALWDGEAVGDGPGGTAHLVAIARDSGAEVEILDTKALFGLG